MPRARFVSAVLATRTTLTAVLSFLVPGKGVEALSRGEDPGLGRALRHLVYRFVFSGLRRPGGVHNEDHPDTQPPRRHSFRLRRHDCVHVEHNLDRCFRCPLNQKPSEGGPGGGAPDLGHAVRSPACWQTLRTFGSMAVSVKIAALTECHLLINSRQAPDGALQKEGSGAWPCRQTP